MRPTLTLSAVFGPGVIYVPSPSPRACHWLGDPDLARCGRMGGSQLCIAGDLPIQHCASLAAPGALELLREAGLEIATDRRVHRSEQERLAQLRGWGDEGWRLAVQHALPPDEVEDRACLVPPKLLSQLNDKGRLSELVAPGSPLPRRVVTPAEVREAVRELGGLPVILKVSTAETTGGGAGNVLCRSDADVAGALARLGGVARLVVERYVDGLRSYCMGAAVLADGSVAVLGGAQQVISEDGHFLANRLDPKAPPPPRAFESVRDVARRAANAGYRGIVGVDLAERPDGRIAIFDLNFRINACSSLLLLEGPLRQRFGSQCLHYQLMTGVGSFEAMLRNVEACMQAGWLLPLFFSNPALAGCPGARPALAGVVPACDEQELGERLEALARRHGLLA